MKKKEKLIATIAALCLSISIMGFGVYAALSVTGKITSSINFVSKDVKCTFKVDVDGGKYVDGGTGTSETEYRHKTVSVDDESVGAAHTLSEFAMGHYTFDPTSEAGKVITYTITIINDGNSPIKIAYNETTMFSTTPNILNVTKTNMQDTDSVAVGANYLGTVELTLLDGSADISVKDLNISYEVSKAGVAAASLNNQNESLVENKEINNSELNMSNDENMDNSELNMSNDENMDLQSNGQDSLSADMSSQEYVDKETGVLENNSITEDFMNTDTNKNEMVTYDQTANNENLIGENNQDYIKQENENMKDFLSNINDGETTNQINTEIKNINDTETTNQNNPELNNNNLTNNGTFSDNQNLKADNKDSNPMDKMINDTLTINGDNMNTKSVEERNLNMENPQSDNLNLNEENNLNGLEKEDVTDKSYNSWNPMVEDNRFDYENNKVQIDENMNVDSEYTLHENQF